MFALLRSATRSGRYSVRVFLRIFMLLLASCVMLNLHLLYAAGYPSFYDCEEHELKSQR